MKKLNWDLVQLTKRNRDGSYATQAARSRNLDLAARQLDALGYKNMRAHSLKMRHVEALVDHWQKEGLSTGTIKNRMSHMRWWAEKIGRPSAIPNDNSALGIPDRRYVTNENKATALDERLEKLADPHIRISLELQAAFGLRREESMKIQPDYADRGDTLVLKDTWTKGGRAREIPVRNDHQREVLDRAHKRAGKGSLIPDGRTYVEHLHAYEQQCRDAGLHKMHGLRHAYAQDRYLELTGLDCPARGGPSHSELKQGEKLLDKEARQMISRELGHEREQITAIYLGS